MGFDERQFFKNSDRSNWQDATNALEEGFTHLVSDSVQFDTTASETSATGLMTWNATDGTTSLGLTGGNVVLKIGEASYARIYNGTAAAFTKGQVIRLEGSQGQRLSVSLAQANSEANSTKTFGVVAEPIARNTEGFVMLSGTLSPLDTNSMTEGALVWLSPSTAGGMTTTKPAAPDHLVLIGQCVKKAGVADGIVFVHIQNGYELDELHNVSITNPQNGQVLKYDSATGLWKNATP